MRESEAAQSPLSSVLGPGAEAVALRRPGTLAGEAKPDGEGTASDPVNVHACLLTPRLHGPAPERGPLAGPSLLQEVLTVGCCRGVSEDGSQPEPVPRALGQCSPSLEEPFSALTAISFESIII